MSIKQVRCRFFRVLPEALPKFRPALSIKRVCCRPLWLNLQLHTGLPMSTLVQPAVQASKPCPTLQAIGHPPPMIFPLPVFARFTSSTPPTTASTIHTPGMWIPLRTRWNLRMRGGISNLHALVIKNARHATVGPASLTLQDLPCQNTTAADTEITRSKSPSSTRADIKQFHLLQTSRSFCATGTFNKSTRRCVKDGPNPVCKSLAHCTSSKKRGTTDPLVQRSQKYFRKLLL